MPDPCSLPVDGPPAVQEAVLALAATTFEATSLDALLHRTCVLVRAALPGAEDVSITLLGDAGPRTAASSGALAAYADTVQYAGGAGPCLQAAATGEAVLVAVLEEEDRWASYGPAALRAGVAASLSLPLTVGSAVGSLNVYATRARAFDPGHVPAVRELARLAGRVLTNADAYYRAATWAEHLQEALDARAVVEQAKGVLVGQRGCTPDRALEVLVQLSQETRRPLRELGEAVVREAVRD